MSNLSAYLLHFRPRSWPIVFFHLAMGALIAGGLGGLGNPAAVAMLVVAGGLWAVGLNGGTLALNTAYDGEQGPVGYLDRPPPIPRHLAAVGTVAIIGATGLGVSVSLGFFYCILACSILSWLYSAPPARLKSRAGWDLAVNAIGYGALTPLAGALAVHVPLRTPVFLICLSFGFLFAGFYPMTQIYQMDEDRAKGDRTLALALGLRGSLNFAISAIAVAISLWFAAGLVAHLNIWRWSLVILAGASWLLVLIPWRRDLEAYPAQKGMYRALWIWGLADLCMVLAFIPLEG